MQSINRRNMLGLTGDILTGLTALQYANAADKPNEKVNLAVMGLRGRGKTLATTFVGFKDVHVAVLCDVDSRLYPDTIKLIVKQQLQGRREPGCRGVVS